MSEQPVEGRSERSGTEPERTQVWASSREAAQFPPDDAERPAGDDEQGNDRDDDKRRAEGESRSED